MTNFTFVEIVSVPSKGGWRTLQNTTTCAAFKRNPIYRNSQSSSRVQMQLPPHTQEEPPLTDAEKGPPDYVWDDNFPGTLKPGSVDDNFPLEKVLASDVYSRMKYQELEMDERDTHIFKPDEDFLQWLAEHGRLLPRELSEDEFDTEAQRQISGITEEDLDFADDDNKMIAYYSKQGEGSAAGASSDFGGFAESSADAGPGF